MRPDPATVAGATDGEGNCPLLHSIITYHVLLQEASWLLLLWKDSTRDFIPCSILINLSAPNTSSKCGIHTSQQACSVKRKTTLTVFSSLQPQRMHLSMAEGYQNNQFLYTLESAISNFFRTDLSNWKITGPFWHRNLHLFPKMNMAEGLTVTIW